MTARMLAPIVLTAVLMIGGIGLALWPFHRDLTHIPDGPLVDPVLRVRCASPVVGAFRSSDVGGGWFNYAPNSNQGVLVSADHPVFCVRGSRIRLAVSVLMILFCGALLRTTLRDSGTLGPEEAPQ